MSWRDSARWSSARRLSAPAAERHTAEVPIAGAGDPVMPSTADLRLAVACGLAQARRARRRHSQPSNSAMSASTAGVWPADGFDRAGGVSAMTDTRSLRSLGSEGRRARRRPSPRRSSTPGAETACPDGTRQQALKVSWRAPRLLDARLGGVFDEGRPSPDGHPGRAGLRTAADDRGSGQGDHGRLLASRLEGDRRRHQQQEWYVFVLLGRFPDRPQTWVVPRDHVAAATWIVHWAWKTDPGAKPGTRNAAIDRARVLPKIWDRYEDRWDLLAESAFNAPVLLRHWMGEKIDDSNVGLPEARRWRDQVSPFVAAA